MNNTTIILRWLALAVLVMSAAVTYLLMNNMEQFYVVNQQVLQDPDFIETHKYWKQKRKNSPVISYAGDVLEIAHDQQTSNEVQQHLKLNTPVYVRLSLEVKSKGIVAENKYWAGGTAAVVSYTAEGARLRHTNVFTIKSDTSFRPYSKIIYLEKDAEVVAVAIRLLRSQGVLSVRNPEFSIMAELPKYSAVKRAIILYWIVMGSILLWWVMKNLSTRVWVWMGGASFVAIAGVLLPAGFITAANKAIFALLPESGAVGLLNIMEFFFGSIATATPSASLSKLAHFLVFMLIGVLIGQAFRRIGLVYGFALIAVFAVVTESLQTLVYGRSTSLRDVYIDISGGLLGMVVGVGCILLLEKIRSAAEPV